MSDNMSTNESTKLTKKEVDKGLTSNLVTLL